MDSASGSRRAKSSNRTSMSCSGMGAYFPASRLKCLTNNPALNDALG
jgi:hypothetical protein